MVKKILVVDDDQDIRDSFKEILEKNGFKVFTAVDCDDCMKKLEKINPDLIIMDIMMPGTPVEECIREIKNIDILYASVVKMNQAEDKNLLSHPKTVGYLEKPVDINLLVKKVEEIFK